MNKIEAVMLRVELFDGDELEEEDDTIFMDIVKNALAYAAQTIVDNAPAHCEVGRFIAGLDSLHVSKAILRTSVVFGREIDTRKRRKITTTTATQSTQPQGGDKNAVVAATTTTTQPESTTK